MDPQRGTGGFLVRLCLTLGGLVLAGVLGVAAAELVPDAQIARNLVEAVHTGVLGRDDRTPSAVGTITDHFGECVASTIGLGDAPDSTPVESGITSPDMYGCPRTGRQLREFEVTGKIAPQPTYLRYWHGYALLTRPALALFGLAGTRTLIGFLVATSMAGLTLSFGRVLGAPAAAALAIPAVLTTDILAAHASIPHGISLATAWASGALAFSLCRRYPGLRAATVAGLLTGALSAYVDLMIAFPSSLALVCAGVAGAGLSTANHPRSTAKATAAGAVGWIVGLAGMWGGKWAVAAPVVGVGRVWREVAHQVGFRTTGAYTGVSTSPVQGVVDNLTTWWSQPLTGVVVAVSVVVTAVAVARSPGQRWRTLLPAAVPPAVTLPWYVILNNHSQIHSWLTYRALPIAWGAGAALILARPPEPFGGRPTPRRDGGGGPADGAPAPAGGGPADGGPAPAPGGSDASRPRAVTDGWK